MVWEGGGQGAQQQTVGQLMEAATVCDRKSITHGKEPEVWLSAVCLT
jgi:hypothetical protein